MISLATISTACAPVTADLPDHVYRCPAEPVPEAIRSQSDFLTWVEDVRQAGAVCRVNLETVAAARD